MPTRKERLHKRRRVIFRQAVLNNHPLSIKEVCALFPDDKYNLKMAERDIAEFEKAGCKIALLPCRDGLGDKEFVYLEGPHTDDDRTREGINPAGKKLVARMAATVICGFSQLDDVEVLPEWMNDQCARDALQHLMDDKIPDEYLAGRIRSVLAHIQEKIGGQDGEWGIGSNATVLKLLKQSATSYGIQQTALRIKLRQFWEEANRLVAIDSGTTNIFLAEYLRELRLPAAGSPLCSLTVCSNSRRIFEILGPSEVSVKCIIVGGQQKFRSPTIAGAMAEHFLRTASILQFGICLLGSTNIDVGRFAICSDSQEEASIKTLIMEKSSLRIVCVDNTKLQGLGREGYKFASIDPMHIDLIITNSPFRKKSDTNKNPEEQFRAFTRSVGAIEGRGVPVLVATSLDTFGHPKDEQEDTPVSQEKRKTSKSKPLLKPE